jgi:hypothetical protein
MKINEILTEAKSAHPQQAAKAIAMKKAGIKPKNESTELEEEFDLIESIIERLAEHNGVDAEVIWEDLETLTEDELYAFAVTSEPIMESQGVAEAEPVPGKYSGHFYDAKLLPNGDYEVIKINSKKDDKGNTNPLDLKVGSIVPKGKAHSLQYANDGGMFDEINRAERSAQFRAQQKGVAEDWQKANKRDKTDGMSQKAVNAYRRENPGSKLKTAVTTKPSKLKKGGKASKRRKSYCSRSRGQMKMHSISCAKTPDKAICKARRRWNC